MHGLDVQAANPVQVAASKIESRAGLEVRHSDVASETVLVRGFRATSLDRTLLDICAWSSAIDALIVLDMAVLAELNSPGRLRQYADSVGRLAGASRLRTLSAIAAPAESPMETRLRWLLLNGGLPAPEVQTDLYSDTGDFVGRADLFYTTANLDVEFDGGNHRERLVSDDRRQNLLVAAGYRILRFTGADIRSRPDAVVAQVRVALQE